MINNSPRKWDNIMILSADETTDRTTSHLTNPAKDAGQVIGYSHSTRLANDASQVAGYVLYFIPALTGSRATCSPGFSPASTSIAPSAVASPNRTWRNFTPPFSSTTYTATTSLRCNTALPGITNLLALPTTKCARTNIPGYTPASLAGRSTRTSVLCVRASARGCTV